MLQHDRAAIAALGAGEGHTRVAGGPDRGAVAGGVIHTTVGTDLVQHRVLAGLGEARADARELDRRAQEGLAHRPAVGVEVAGAAFGGGEVDGLQRTVALLVLHGDDPRVAQGRFAVDFVGLLVDDLQAVAAADVALEVDVPGKDVGQLHDHAVTQPHLPRRQIQAVGNRAAELVGPRAVGALDAGLQEALVGAARDVQRLQRAQGVGQGDQAGVVVDHEVEGLARAQRAQPAGIAIDLGQREPVLGAHAGGAQQPRQAVAGLDADALGFDGGLGLDFRRGGRGRVQRLEIDDRGGHVAGRGDFDALLGQVEGLCRGGVGGFVERQRVALDLAGVRRRHRAHLP